MQNKNRFWRMSLLTLVIGVAAFLTGPKLWPMAPSVPEPPSSLLPLYIVLAAVEALAFGFAVTFALFGWPAIRRLPLGAPWLNKSLFISLCWFMGNWWMHDNLHMHIAFDMNRLLYIEYGFHISMIACVLILTVGFIRLATHPAAKPILSPDRVASD
jgi:hypothetical protein